MTTTNYPMRSLLVKILLLLLWAWPTSAQEVPEPMKPARLVNDFATVLNRVELNKLEAMLVAFDDSTSTQIAVVTLPSLNGNQISDFATKLFEKWGIGGAEFNNGVLILLALEEREVWIETGYGVEDRLTDALARRIIEREMVPRFKQGDYAGGLHGAAKAVVQVLEGAYSSNGKQTKGEPNGRGLFIIIFLIIILVIIMNSRNGGGQSFSGKGRAGYQPPFFFPMGGGSFGGGGFGGGGGGGFGGFGGGMSGGGGAGGRW